jgi:tetratricopeptide (TPR) repeat protein
MILGATAIRPSSGDNLSTVFVNFQVLSADSGEQHTALAEEARQKVGASNDFTLLLKAASILLQARNVTLDFDPVPLAVQYLQRAAALSPPPDQMDAVRFLLNEVNDRSRQRRIRQLPNEDRYKAAMALGDRDRFELFWDLAVSQYYHADSFGSAHEDYLREWNQVEQYALELASVSKKFRKDPDYGNAVFNANIMLAYAESKKGDTQRTLDYLREALKAQTA